MGCYRHKFNNVAFDQETILEPIVHKILENTKEDHHAVVFYGAKKSGKKELISRLLVNLKDHIL